MIAWTQLLTNCLLTAPAADFWASEMRPTVLFSIFESQNYWTSASIHSFLPFDGQKYLAIVSVCNFRANLEVIFNSSENHQTVSFSSRSFWVTLKKSHHIRNCDMKCNIKFWQVGRLVLWNANNFNVFPLVRESTYFRKLFVKTWVIKIPSIHEKFPLLLSVERVTNEKFLFVKWNLSVRMCRL